MERQDFSVKTTDDDAAELHHSYTSDDPEDANVHSTGNDAATDYENDAVSNADGDMKMPTSPLDQLTAVSSVLLTANVGDGALADSRSIPLRQSHVSNSAMSRRALMSMDDTATRRGTVDDDREGLSLHLPSRSRISPSEHFDDERDPNYATQRPDTLGAINVTDAAVAFAGPIARPVYQAAQSTRAWPVETATEDGSFTDDRTAHLGRRTCGAGMDEVELNQRQLMVDDIDDENDAGDGSELCDDDDDEDDDDEIGLGSSNQCESTEADQYKMAPEADQTAGVASGEQQENGSAPMIGAEARPGAQGCTLGRRRRTDGAVSDTSHDMDDPEEDQADRADNAELEPAAASLPVSAPQAAANAASVTCDEHKRGALKQHPQSAFSVPKPRVTKSKPGESAPVSYANKPVPSVRQSKSNADIVFKPIITCFGKSNSAAHVVRNGSEGLTVAGESSQYSADKRQLSAPDSGISSQGKKDVDGDVDLLHRHRCKQGQDVISSSAVRSLWNREPLRNTVEQPIVVWNDGHTCTSGSLASACHLSGEGGAIAFGTFAPASSSSQQATPQKTVTHACHMLDNSVDMSPIQPESSSSSRPLSANGIPAVNLASGHYVLPSSEFYLDTKGPLSQYSHKVCPDFFVCL